jgi:hypothetical protein
MLKFSKILLVFFLIVTFFFNSSPAYAISEIIADSISDQSSQTINLDELPNGIMKRTHKESSDGYEDSWTIDPSIEGARNGAIGGAIGFIFGTKN